jgi:hypothetical protein
MHVLTYKNLIAELQRLEQAPEKLGFVKKFFKTSFARIHWLPTFTSNCQILQIRMKTRERQLTAVGRCTKIYRHEREDERRPDIPYLIRFALLDRF